MIERFATALGIESPDSLDWIAAGAAAATILLAVIAGWAAGRWGGPPLIRSWARYAGGKGEGVQARLCATVRWLVSWLLLSLALRVHTWPPLAGLLLGIAAAIGAALLVVSFVRGLGVARLIAWLLGAFAFAAALADAVGGLEPMTVALDGVAVTLGAQRVSLLNLFQIAIGLAILYLAVRLANRIIGHGLKGNRALDPAQRLLAEKLAGVAILVVAFFVALGIVGIDLTALALFSGAFGLAIGFGLQKTVGNLFAGIILLMDRSIKPGDVIVVGDSFGSVNKIGVRAVSVVTRDGKEHLIPNEDLMTREVENWSYSSRDVRMHIPIGVSYHADLKLARRLMIEAAEASARVLKTPKPNVWLRDFGDSSVDFEILVWIVDPEAGVGSVRSEILSRLWDLFAEHGIEIPFPQRDLHIRDWPDAPAPRSVAKGEG